MLPMAYHSPRCLLAATPIEFRGGSNWYAYVGNNPVNYADPLGLDGISKKQPPTPTPANLLKNPDVIKAIRKAWKDSDYKKPTYHEESGWIFYNQYNGKISIRRDPPGNKLFASMNADNIPTVEDSILVATFHTHPFDNGDTFTLTLDGETFRFKNGYPWCPSGGVDDGGSGDIPVTNQLNVPMFIKWSGGIVIVRPGDSLSEECKCQQDAMKKHVDSLINSPN